jgi:DNA-binding MarR family transcriptional regulator
VEREDCPDDGRGAFVVLTPTGHEAIERSAPEHARTVRELVFDALTDEELDSLATFTSKVLNRVQRGRKPKG